MARAGEPAQYPSAHLLLHRREVFRCQRGRLGKALFFPGGKHPIDHTAAKVEARSRARSSAVI
ncbi:MAG: hypothetical protein ACREVM_00760 [Burkholderiales bacterium]